MEKIESRDVIRKELDRYRTKSYSELNRLIKEVDTYVIVVPSGRKYQIEIHAVWDNKPNSNLRVICDMSSGFWTSIFPLCESFIISPEGRFIGE